MSDSINQLLLSALEEKKLNKKAYDEIFKWLSDDEFSEFQNELSKRISEKKWDNLMDSFYRVLIFGTGGLRGVMDIGTNRINKYMIRWASQAYSQYLLKHKADIAKQGIAIAYDSRHLSKEFMEETARVLAANEIPVYVYDYYKATPQLSFTVRELKCAGGIVLTASHNPPEFNGYKVYDENGVQVLPDVGILIEEQFNAVKEIKKITFSEAVDNKIIQYTSKDIDKKFKDSARKASTYLGRNVKIVFSPLHGVGSQSVLPVLKELGFEQITCVEEQMSLDGDFPTVENNFPNPEFAVVYKKPIELAKKINADIVLVSDPDADRLGMAIPDAKGDWIPLNGNQGAVLMEYFLLENLSTSGKLPKNSVLIKTSVTTDLFKDIGESFGAEVIGDLLVGFKFIGDRIQHLPQDKNFIFAAEESVGYLFGNAYRDKGAETPAVIAAEMAAYCKDKGISPMEMLESIYQKYGYYAERLFYKLIEGFGSFDQMNMAMEELRKNLPTTIGGKKVLKILDRLTGEMRDGQTGKLIETRSWDKGDMLSFFFTEDERTVVHTRPSGTEPKMKYYTMVKGKLQEKSKEQIEEEALVLEKSIAQTFEDILKKIKVDVFE